MKAKPQEQFIQLDFSDEMKNSYRDYAMSVIIARALPDVRDGLKPVQRRILYSMNELGLEPKKPHRKSARIVGDTMGKYHPHGDSSIYEALVHMSEDYSLSMPLVDGHGNFGSIDGDGAAAMRYTEARLSEAAMPLLDHLDDGLVEFIPNFDDSEKEPTVLPAMLPNLLINGTVGIAVGMSTNIPPHNAGEAIRGTIAYMENPAITVAELMEYIPGPDFPTGGVITNADSLPAIYETGEGKIKIRAKIETENGENGRKNLVITEIPYTSAGSKSKLVETLVDLMANKTFEEIYDVRDESSKEGIRIVIEVKKDRNIDNLLNGLYKKSPLEETYSVSLLAVKDYQPHLFNLKSMIREFVDFQDILYTREYTYLLNKARDRREIVEGLIGAVDVIDLIIEVLRGSDNIKQAKACLIKGDITDIRFKSEASKKAAAKLNFTERQAEAILSMQLSKLIGLEIKKLNDELAELIKNIANYEKVLGSKKELYKVIIANLRAFEKKFDRPRRTVLLQEEKASYVIEEKIENLVVLIDKFGYTKAVDMSTYQKLSPDQTQEFIHTIYIQSNDKLCLFTAEGNMYQTKVSAIPRCKPKDKGVLIHNLCKVDKEDILCYFSLEHLNEAQLLFVTKYGFVKRVSGIEFDTTRTMVQATKLELGDYVVAVVPLSSMDVLTNNRRVIMLTAYGLSLGFSLEEVPELKKTSRGVKGISLDKDDFLVFSSVVAPDDESFGFKGKKYSAKKVKIKKRGAKGTKTGLLMM